MSLKIYQIDTTINNPDNMAGYQKNDGEDIYSFFRLDMGDEDIIKKKKMIFIAGNGYTKQNIGKTDYIFCPCALLFSERFVKKVEAVLINELQFIPCKIMCQGDTYEWYAARIIRRLPLIDKEASTYITLSEGEKIYDIIKYRTNIEDNFFIAKDVDSITDFAVSELFRELCVKNELNINFKKVN